MTEPAPYPRQDPGLRLRGRIRPVTRINRRVLMAGAVLAALLLVGVLALALAPPKARPAPSESARLAGPGKRAPEGIERLPASYEGVTPRLGAPATGDLGGAIVAEERAWGIEPDWDVAPTSDFRPSDTSEAERARRLSEAKLADAASKAGVFFDLSSRAAPAQAAEGGPAPVSPASDLIAWAASRAEPGQGAGVPAPDANLQARKIAFAGAGPDAATRNPYALEDLVSPYTVMAGSVLPAYLLTAINSDLPGMVTAQVSQPVRDTVTGTHLLIPQGARLIGRYQSEVSFGQERALVTWERIIFPDGASVVISEPATDAAGAAGLGGRTDHHWDRAFAAAGLATLLGIGAAAGDDSESDLERAVRRGVSDTVSRAGDRVVDQQLGVQPTLRIAQGTPVRVLVTRDLVLRPYPEHSP
jgi:type IV secretory pathway VirB10-like protein